MRREALSFLHHAEGNDLWITSHFKNLVGHFFLVRGHLGCEIITSCDSHGGGQTPQIGQL